MKFNLACICLLLCACSGPHESSRSGLSWFNKLFTGTTSFTETTGPFAPGSIENHVINLEDKSVNVATDLYVDHCESDLMEVIAWGGAKAGIAWKYNELQQGHLLLGPVPGFSKSLIANIDIALGHKGKTAMLVFQANGRVFYNVYNWTNQNGFEKMDGPLQLGKPGIVGYGAPKVDCDTENDDQLVITWASYRGGRTNTKTAEILAVSGYINGKMFRINNPVPISTSGGVDTSSRSKRPDVACKNGKVYFTYNYEDKDEQHHLAFQEVEWAALQNENPQLPKHTILQEGDNEFKRPQIAANEKQDDKLEWQVVTSEELDGKHRIIGFTGFFNSDQISSTLISDTELNNCSNSHPDICMGEEYATVTWVHDHSHCAHGFVEKDILVQRLSAIDGEVLGSNGTLRLNSQQIGDQLAISVAGSPACDFLHFGFFDASAKEIVSKSSYNGNIYSTPPGLDLSEGLQEGDNTGTHLQVHPNPANLVLNIDFRGNWESTARLELFNKQAVMVESYQVPTHQTFRIDVSHLENGLIHVRARDASSTYLRKVQIQH